MLLTIIWNLKINNSHWNRVNMFTLRKFNKSGISVFYTFIKTLLFSIMLNIVTENSINELIVHM